MVLPAAGMEPGGKALGALGPGQCLTPAWCALQVTVCSLVEVQPWSSPESHGAGAQCPWAIEGAEAAYPSAQEEQTSSP